MIFRQLNQGPCRTYLLGSERTREVVLVDPVLEGVERYLRLLQTDGLKLRWVIDTHTHSDHLSGAPLLQERAQVHYLMHLNSAVRCVSKKLRERDALGLGEMTMTFVHAPGHTRDSLLVVLPDRFLSGDFLFIGDEAAGRLDLPGGSPIVHYQSLRKLDQLPDGVQLFPGHDRQGRESSTLKAERQANPLLRPQSRDEYVAWWDRRSAPCAEWMRKVIEANEAGATEPSASPIPPEAASGVSAAVASAARAPALSPIELRDRTVRDAAGLFILDVREADEFVSGLGHIPGSVLIPLGQLGDRLAEVPRDKAVVAVCRSGGKSARAAELLLSKGWRETYSLSGGVQAWKDEKLPVES